MKKRPITIEELDVQPISDEELRALGPGVAGAGTERLCCLCNSRDWVCCWYIEEIQ